jgi:GNAT superfamily N-acetyltransferase
MEVGMDNKINVRQGNEADVPLILKLIRELAEYEKLLDQVVATEDTLMEWIFIKKGAEVIIGEIDGEPAGFALFFCNFSTFLGRSGVYLEDLFVVEEKRGLGLGRAMLGYIARLALERGYGRFEWACLDWNEPSIKFYRSLGAVSMDDWTVYRVTGESMKLLAESGSLT